MPASAKTRRDPGIRGKKIGEKMVRSIFGIEKRGRVSEREKQHRPLWKTGEEEKEGKARGALPHLESGEVR